MKVISFSSLQNKIQFLYVYAGCVAICGICKLYFAPLYNCVINSLFSFHNECEYSKFSFDSPIRYRIFKHFISLLLTINPIILIFF